MITLNSPVTGGTQTGFTAPTYTVTPDNASDVNGKQWAVTALGGTQALVRAHTATDPFTFTYWKPKFYRLLGKANPTTGLISNVPKNIHRINVFKGVQVAAGQPVQIAYVKAEVGIPAGSESYDAANLRAMCSLFTGGLWQIASGAGDTWITNIS